MQTIMIEGRAWRVKSRTAGKLVLLADASPLKKWRQKKNLTTRAASKILGISCGQISKIEAGERGFPETLLPLLK